MDILKFYHHLKDNEIKNSVNIKLRNNGKVLQIGEEYYKTRIQFDSERLIDYLKFLIKMESANIRDYKINESHEIKVYFNVYRTPIKKSKQTSNKLLTIIQHK